MAKNKDIGVVLIPDNKCQIFVNEMQNEVKKNLPDYNSPSSYTHITLFHIANVQPESLKEIKEVFHEFTIKNSLGPIKLPVKGIKATGGGEPDGYKWLDLQFETAETLAELRQNVVSIFAPFHNGTLERMNDDIANFNEAQKTEVEEYGVNLTPYTPHCTAWYVNLPVEQKTSRLAEIADILNEKNIEKEYQAEHIALVELGRNGNALEIIEEVTLLGKDIIN